jgi:hypothetical protein
MHWDIRFTYWMPKIDPDRDAASDPPRSRSGAGQSDAHSAPALFHIIRTDTRPRPSGATL